MTYDSFTSCEIQSLELCYLSACMRSFVVCWFLPYHMFIRRVLKNKSMQDVHANAITDFHNIMFLNIDALGADCVAFMFSRKWHSLFINLCWYMLIIFFFLRGNCLRGDFLRCSRPKYWCSFVKRTSVNKFSNKYFKEVTYVYP